MTAMEQKIRPITFNIYARDAEEAEKGRRAIVEFINIMGQHRAMVTGEKLADAVKRLHTSPFIASQIINFFKR